MLATLAAHLARRVFAETHFVTDDRGAEIAEALCWPFSEVRRDLQACPSEGLEHIWALGKLAAGAIQDRPFVQFDCDVLLLKRLPEKLCDSRLFAQSVDFPNYYRSPEMVMALKRAGSETGTTAYNAGLMGGADVALVRAYAWAGRELAQKFRSHPLNGTTTSMVIEQYQLGVFAERVGVEVGTLLPMLPSKPQLAEAGYVHLTGGAKHSRLWISSRKRRRFRWSPS